MRADPHSTTEPDGPAVQARGLHKRFGATVALHDVSFALRRSSLHALIGENGAGKSTALGCVAGRITHDAGRLSIRGRVVQNPTPRTTRSLGVAAIYQELTVLPAMSAMANVFVGSTPALLGLVDRRAQEARFRELAGLLDLKIDPRARAGDLSVADQQLLEIMRALHTRSRVMLFDEPTASLAAPERRRLLALLLDLKRRGVSMALVSHNLDEVMEVADDITVFRDGVVVESGPRSRWTRRELVAAMLGQAAAAGGSAHAGRRGPRSPVLSVRGLQVSKRLHVESLDVDEGEIVGVAGLVGSGRTTLLRAIAGSARITAGRMRLGGAEVRWPTSVAAAIRTGIGFVPEDRKALGLVPSLSAAANIVLSDLPSVARRGIVTSEAVRSAAGAAADRFGLPPAMQVKPVRNLSGGNQQKALLARWLHRTPRVLLADEPTRGIDIGAKATILATLSEMAGDGLAVLLVSSDNEELIGVADRIVVMNRGRIVDEFDNRERQVTEEQILHAAFDVKEDHHADG